MHKITKIQVQIKNKNRVNVYIDDIYSFSCDTQIIVKYKLKEGLQVNKEDLVQLIEESNENKAFQMAIHYLSYKARTQSEVSSYLLNKEYKNSIIDKVLEKLQYYRYIDDRQYTKSYISSAIEGKKKSISSIKAELLKRGVSLEIIEEFTDLISSDVNLEIAKEISMKYFQQKSNLPFNQVKSKLSQLLLRKGFGWEIINQCLSHLENHNEVQATIESNEEQYKLQAVNFAEKYFIKYSKKETNSFILEKKVKYALYQKGYDKDTIDFAFQNIKKNS